MINHILANKLYDEDFVTTHTNALFLGDVEFGFKDGLFSGFDEAEAHIRHEDVGISARPPGEAKACEEPG